jgi:hypothetical protein
MNAGGNAFPFVSHGGFHEHQVCEGGMTLRDYFAAAALQGMLACSSEDQISNPMDWNHGHFAEAAYMQADAMLKQREKA